MSKNLEYEIRIYDINERKIKKILKENGAELVQKKTIMPLIVYNHPKGKKDSYIRIRDEGHEITYCVSPEYHGKGVGTFMIQKFSPRWAWVDAYVKVDNIASQKVFEKLGFEKQIYYKYKK